MEAQMYRVIEQVFNNWTALQLAVEHEMGGPDSRQTAVQCIEYMVKYCLSDSNVQIADIQEALDDIMDEEFDTICEDNSLFEVASVLHRFVILLKEGNLAQYEQEYQSLPTCKVWLSKPQPQQRTAEVGESSSTHADNESSEVPMEQDAEWTEVKPRRRK